MRRILDLGCGQGKSTSNLKCAEEDILYGVDIYYDDLHSAKLSYQCCRFCCAAGEALPFSSESIDRVTSYVAIPYMNIPTVLAEIYRITKPCAEVHFTLHTFKFTLAEFKIAFPGFIPLLFRSYVLLNGVIFHLTGTLLPFVTGKTESWQSEFAITRALRHAGFSEIKVDRPASMFVVDARRL